MIIKESNQRIINFRIKSVEKHFSKTDTFHRYKSTNDNRRPSVKYKSIKNTPLNSLLSPSNIPHAPNTNNKILKRIMPKSLHFSRPQSKKRSIDKKEKLLVDSSRIHKI